MPSCTSCSKPCWIRHGEVGGMSMDQYIALPFGGRDAGFHVSELVAHLRNSGLGYIIQGQQNCAFEYHTKPHSLDYWLRERFTEEKNAKQATNAVIDDLIATGLFAIAYLPCPDSGRWCKALMLVDGGRNGS